MNAETQKIDALLLIQQRNEFYKKKYHQILGLVVLSIVIIGILLAIFLFLLKNNLRPFYFLANDVGSFMQEIPTDKPFPEEYVAAWTAEALIAVNSFDYVNYRSQLQNAQKYFTDAGWTQFMKALTESNNLLTIQDRKWIFTATIVDKPKLLKEGISGGYYLWRFEVPVLLKFLQPPSYDKNSATFNAVTYEVIVQRQPLLQSYKGLAVYTLIGTTAMKPIGPTVMPAS